MQDFFFSFRIKKDFSLCSIKLEQRETPYLHLADVTLQTSIDNREDGGGDALGLQSLQPRACASRVNATVATLNQFHSIAAQKKKQNYNNKKREAVGCTTCGSYGPKMCECVQCVTLPPRTSLTPMHVLHKGLFFCVFVCNW